MFRKQRQAERKVEDRKLAEHGGDSKMTITMTIINPANS